MTILVPGGAGMHGHDLESVVSAAGEGVTIASRQLADVTSPDACRSAVDHRLVLRLLGRDPA